jgi:hypothetical protein
LALEFSRVSRSKLLKIFNPPANGRKVLRVFALKEGPIGCCPRETHEKRFVLVTDASRMFTEEPNSRLKQRFQGHWFSRHADKRGLILLRDVFGRREEHFVHRPIVPGKVCDKALDRPLCESIGFVHLRDIKEV